MTTAARHDSSTGPRFSVVAAAYNVAKYIDDFLHSLAAQTLDHTEFEVVVVDDGSTDDTAERVRRFADTSDIRVTLISQQNAGQGAARNAGTAAATGEWITYPDPDDWVEGNYLEFVDDWLSEHPDIDLVATNRVMFQEASGVVEEKHPLRGQFYMNHNVRIDRFPNYFHGSAPAAFFRRARVAETGLEFSPLIRSNFEDGHFCVRYLLDCDNPTIAFLKDARYYYRKRADNSSTLQNKHVDPAHFIDSPRHGYLDVLKRATRGGEARSPEWLQNFILYELSWYFTEDHQMKIPTVATGSVGAEFRDILAEIATYLDPEVVYGFDLRWFPLVARQALVHGFRSEDWHTPYVVLDAVDEQRKLAKFVYRYRGEAPRVTFQVGGAVAAPAFRKERAVEYFGAEVLTEVIAWVTFKHTVTVRIDGRGLPIRRGWPGPERFRMRTAQIRRAFGLNGGRSANSGLRARLSAMLKPRRGRLTFSQWAAQSIAAQWRYRDGWVLMDRTGDADDSAEILFAYLRTNHPEVNARFVISRSAPAWRRLRREHGRRVVAYGSWRWKAVLTFASYLISSHADHNIVNPPLFRDFGGKPKWKFVFLQHGVIKDDISRWLNTKDISLFVTSTPDEYASIAGNHTPYNVTAKEVVLSGLPRFDALESRERARSAPPRKIVFAPTWREWLSHDLQAGQTLRDIHADFAESDYAKNWLGALTSDRVRQAAAAAGATIALLPHPNLRRMAELVSLPEHVELLDFEDGNAQQNFVDAAVLVTDYSSMAFNAAYLRRPVVYFQFDRERYEAGAHIARPGYFDYERDGFGPYTTELDGAIDAVVGLIEAGFEADSEHRQRIDQAFPYRDGLASSRVYSAIVELGVAYDDGASYR